MKNKILSFLLQILIFVVIFYGIEYWQTRHLLSDSGNISAPNFNLVSLDNKTFSLSQLSKSTTVLYFFAPWCKVCHYSIGNLEDLYQAKKEEGINVFAIALDWQSLNEMKQYRASHKLTMPILLGDSSIQAAYHIEGFPTYYVLDKNRLIKKVSMGYSTELGLRLNTF